MASGTALQLEVPPFGRRLDFAAKERNLPRRRETKAGSRKDF
jgi:hypothetical protein